LKHNTAKECSDSFKKVIDDCPNLKTVHTDNGSEFKEKFDDLLKERDHPSFGEISYSTRTRSDRAG
jgi:hypothetical protein